MAPPSGRVGHGGRTHRARRRCSTRWRARGRRRFRPGPCRPARTGRTRGPARRHRVPVRGPAPTRPRRRRRAGRSPRSACPPACGAARWSPGWRSPGAGGPRRRAITTGSGASRVTARSGAVATASLQASAASTARSTGTRSPGPVLVEAGQQQQILDQDLHAGRFLFDAAQDGRQVDSGVVAAEPEQLGEALDRRQRRAQLVGRVGQELAQAQLGRVPLGEGGLDVVEHGVEGQAELADLARAAGRRHPLRQVAGGDGPGRGRPSARAAAARGAGPATSRPRGPRASRAAPAVSMSTSRCSALVTSVVGMATTRVPPSGWPAAMTSTRKPPDPPVDPTDSS